MPDGSTTNRYALDLPQRHAPGRLLDPGQGLARLLDLHVHRRPGLDPAFDAPRNQCIVAQLPPLIPRKRLRPTTRGRSHARLNSTLTRAVDTSVSASMERSAALAAALKLSQSRRSSRAAVSSTFRRSASSRWRSREVKSFGLEVMLIQRSLRPPPLSAVQIAGGHVVLALARHLKADFLQGGDHVGAALHRAVLDALHQVVADQLARVGFVLEAGPQLRRLDVGAMARLLCPGLRRVVRAAPAVLVVEGVAQRVEGPLPARRRDVQAAARLQVALRGEDVRVDAAAALAVQHGRPRVAVRLESRPRRLLEFVEDGSDLRVGRLVVRRPRDLADEIVDGRPGRARAMASSNRSNDTRWAVTATASAAEACVFAQRASWFRLLPMRAICWVRSRSMARAGALQVRVRAIAVRRSAVN